MKYLSSLIVVCFLVLTSASAALAGRHGRPVTPYGDSCDLCTKYGICKTMLTHDDAKKAMLDYYYKKGFGVELVKKRGRFIRANIREKDKGKVVDVIIFDRRTGRIRSIY